MSWEPFLRDKLRKYPRADLCRRQILAAMATYKDLRPSLQKFVHNDGRENELVSLDGTIPVSFHGATYNIPVCIFLQETHPFIPPLVYVRPTSTMAIKSSKHVDIQGRVFLPYLTEWKHPRSDIPALIQILCCIFAEQPPVYSKPPDHIPPSQPGMPRPYGGYGPPTASTNTPYPAGPQRMPMPMSGGPGVPRPPYSSHYPPSGGAVPAPYPSSTAAGPTHYPPSTAAGPTHYPPSTGAGPTPYPPSTGAGPAPYPPSTGAGPTPYTPRPPASQMPQYPPAPVSQATPMQLSTNRMTKQQLTSQNSISEDTIKMSLLSAVEDKLRRRVKATFEQAQFELDGLNKTQQELKKGSQKLEDIVKQLEKEQSDVENNIKILTQKNEEITGVITKLESESDKLAIDEAVVATAPLYNQILTLFAEENATEDTIYYLSEALRKEAVVCDVFLKQIRILSRKQFLLRALLQKARRTAGLNDMTGS